MDYNKQMELDIKYLREQGLRPTLLLHACCGSCSSAVLERLADFFEITIYYYNPNIYPEEEFVRRREELLSFAKKFPPAKNVRIVTVEYNPQEFYNAVDVESEKELAEERERGERCRRCYEFRLKKSFEYAIENNFDYVTTTLSISPFKDSEKINTIGRELAFKAASDSIENKNTKTKSATKFLYADFKKKNGFLRSLEISKEYDLYRQEYCGCVFSMRNRSSLEEQK